MEELVKDKAKQITKKVYDVEVLRSACKKIAPLWSLENFVAVNPYLGLIDKDFNEVARQLDHISDVQMTLPVSFYLNKIETGEIQKGELEHLLSANQKGTYDNFIQRIKEVTHSDHKQIIPTVSLVAASATQTDWNRLIINRVSFWASGYFDESHQNWKSKIDHHSLYESWKSESSYDRTLELLGLHNFRTVLKKYPDTALEASQYALSKLKIPDNMLPLYLHGLLLKVGGWAAFAARVDWDKELYGGKDGELIEFLAVLLTWEACLLDCVKFPNLTSLFQQSMEEFALSESIIINKQLEDKLILQEAFDYSMQRKMVQQFNSKIQSAPKIPHRPSAQAVFCIDVRSEVFRRKLEETDNTIETFGFAGFFAFPIKFVPIAHQDGEAQCPVLLKTGPTILEEMSSESETRKAYSMRVLNHQARQLLKSVKYGAVTCFSYVSPLGIYFLPKLFTDSFGLTRPVPDPNNVGLSGKLQKNKRIRLSSDIHNNASTGISLEDQVTMAKNALTAMSLKDSYAKFVLIVGHGSSTVNNPHATGLDCGACGGHTGEANAKVAAAIFNDPEVREGLLHHGIHIPKETVFLACLHDTTTDEIHIYNEYEVSPKDSGDLEVLKKSLKDAGKLSRMERSKRFSSVSKSDIDDSVIQRSKDWSQIRPEWGLAGCYGFVVAPRERTKGIDFGGRSFLHSYNWEKDTEFAVLELIMTAPMIVTSWINLQYYASTVDNKNFGSGNKTLHNITSGIGVLEGYTGDLRVGLPWQSVFDGENYQHEPVKLNVIIEAPIEAMNKIIAKHSSVRNLLDNNWVHLLAINAEGKISHRYEKNLNWIEIQ